MSQDTAIHAMVRKCRAGEFPSRVAAVDSGWVVMAERQVTEGYCLLLPDPVVGHLNELSGERRAVFMRDMGALGDVLLSVTGAVRINYAIFGNVEPALHLHAFPRYANEPEAARTAQPWALNWDLAPAFTKAVHGGLRRRIAAGLAAIHSSR
jgi:diadenosine tetraphosphate (Ap4A) HIT family hydrolase